jgi:hypothetical protein
MSSSLPPRTRPRSYTPPPPPPTLSFGSDSPPAGLAPAVTPPCPLAAGFVRCAVSIRQSVSSGRVTAYRIDGCTVRFGSRERMGGLPDRPARPPGVWISYCSRLPWWARQLRPMHISCSTTPTSRTKKACRCRPVQQRACLENEWRSGFTSPSSSSTSSSISAVFGSTSFHRVYNHGARVVRRRFR